MENAIEYRNYFIANLGCCTEWANKIAILSIGLEIKTHENLCKKLTHFDGTNFNFTSAQRIILQKIKVSNELLIELKKL